MTRFVLTGQPPDGGQRRAVGPLPEDVARETVRGLQVRGWAEVWMVAVDELLTAEAALRGLSKPGTQAVMTADWWARHSHGLAGAAGRRFVATLIARVHQATTPAAGLVAGCALLKCDYEPVGLLAEVIQEAGLQDTVVWPRKTVTRTYEHFMIAKLGYGARFVLGWASQEWLATRPLCDHQKWDERREAAEPGYDGEPFLCALPVYHEQEHDFSRPIEGGG